MIQSKLSFLGALVCVLIGCMSCSDNDRRYHIYVGTYTDGESKGLYVAEFDPDQRTLSEVRLAAELQQTTFQTINSDHSILFSTGIEDGLGENNGVLKSFAIQSDGGLKEISVRPTRKSPVLAYVNLQEKYGQVFTVSYHGGEVYAFPVDPFGKIGVESGFAKHKGGSNVVKDRQDIAHPHSVFLHPQQPRVYVPDLGQDAVVIYDFDPNTGGIKESSRLSTAPGSGPRHMTFHSSGKFAYVNNEIASTVNLLKVDSVTGQLSLIETHSTLPDSFNGSSTTAQILLSPYERNLYVSNRGHNSIAIFGVDQYSGELTSKGQFPSGGRTPRNFSIDPTGKWMAIINQDSNNLVIYEVDPKTGLLEDTGLKVTVPKPACVTFAKAGHN